MFFIRLDNVSVNYGEIEALKNLTLTSRPKGDSPYWPQRMWQVDYSEVS